MMKFYCSCTNAENEQGMLPDSPQYCTVFVIIHDRNLPITPSFVSIRSYTCRELIIPQYNKISEIFSKISNRRACSKGNTENKKNKMVIKHFFSRERNQIRFHNCVQIIFRKPFYPAVFQTFQSLSITL